MEHTIKEVRAREVLDSRGNPTVEAEVVLMDGCRGVSMVPSGASTGMYEACELRDNDEKRYGGKGVLKAVANVNNEINTALINIPFKHIGEVDAVMIGLDGTTNKSRLGANAILAVSFACAKAMALCENKPLYRYLHDYAFEVYGFKEDYCIPVPMMNVLNGGAHTTSDVDFQEFMIMPAGAKDIAQGIQWCVEIYHNLKKILIEKQLPTGVGDEGGFAPNLAGAINVFEILNEAVEKTGLKLGEDIVYTMDAAASELFNDETGMYIFKGESNILGVNVVRTGKELIEYYRMLTNRFPIASIEDGLNENDWDGWRKLTLELGKNIQLVGDDLFVTNQQKLCEGIEKGCANAILIKPNQIGSVSETVTTIIEAKNNGYNCVMSHRSGETGDTFIADFAVGLGINQIKTGAPCRSERVEKYNRLLKIWSELNAMEKMNRQ